MADGLGRGRLGIRARVVFFLELSKSLFGKTFLRVVFVAPRVRLFVLKVGLSFDGLFGVEEHFVAEIRTFLDV